MDLFLQPVPVSFYNRFSQVAGRCNWLRYWATFNGERNLSSHLAFAAIWRFGNVIAISIIIVTIILFLYRYRHICCGAENLIDYFFQFFLRFRDENISAYLLGLEIC